MFTSALKVMKVEEVMRAARAALTAKLIHLKEQAGGLKIEALGLLKNQAGILGKLARPFSVISTSHQTRVRSADFTENAASLEDDGFA